MLAGLQRFDDSTLYARPAVKQYRRHPRHHIPQVPDSPSLTPDVILLRICHCLELIPTANRRNYGIFAVIDAFDEAMTDFSRTQDPEIEFYSYTSSNHISSACC
jgi:hypothetical protein